jgi:diguanylate cyclase (GGDEF)-like protein/putative nucleotidyltransferase with HDIG domain
MEMPLKARLYWIAAMAAGVSVIVSAGISFNLRQENLWKVALYLLAAIFGAGLKIKLPGVVGTLSMNSLFIIVSLLELQLESAVLIGISSVLAQILIRPKVKPTWEQVAFGAFTIPVVILAASRVISLRFFASIDPTGSLALISASMVYFLFNTGIVAIIVGLTSGKSAIDVWRDNFLWTYPQYLVGGALAGALHLMNRFLPWQVLLLSGPPVYLVYRSYTLYLGRMDEQQKHISEMAQLHWRTIEALALAIEAKDDTTAAHLKRVQVYAAEIARALKLSDLEIKALEAASLLHDIGKLAVPEYIISKPGRLTPEEFEKMKIHPVVGAEILERVNFPYPVVPIVRSHHEKYDGSGYPDGLRGEEIPIGARILSAVDCLDALASDRQYRPALPLEEAMEIVAKESGKSFDPRIVSLLQERHKELERRARLETTEETNKLSSHVKVERGSAPAAGFARESSTAPVIEANFTLAIANARREVQHLVEITNDLGNSLSLDETLALLAVRLGNMIPHDAIVIYLLQGGKLVPQFVKGESFRLFSSLEIPVGHGLSGWVVENDLPIVNGNPAVEPGYLNDPQKITALRSAISVPLPGQSAVIGVLSLYHLKPDAFNQDHLRVLLAIRSKVGLAIENSLRFSRAKNMAEKDELTGLPNAGSLFRLLEQELRNAIEGKTSLAVIVLDLNGFKQANDVHGHLAGNRVLQEVANGLLACCRHTDHVARLGGDEFVLVLADADAATVSSAMRRIQELGPEAGMKVCGEPLVTISSGVAMYPQDGTDAESLLEKADQLMYQAKKETKRKWAGLRRAQTVVSARPVVDSPDLSGAALEFDGNRLTGAFFDRHEIGAGGVHPPGNQRQVAEANMAPASATQ